MTTTGLWVVIGRVTSLLERGVVGSSPAPPILTGDSLIGKTLNVSHPLILLETLDSQAAGVTEAYLAPNQEIGVRPLGGLPNIWSSGETVSHLIVDQKSGVQLSSTPPSYPVVV